MSQHPFVIFSGDLSPPFSGTNPTLPESFCHRWLFTGQPVSMEHLWVDACSPMRADEPCCCSSFWYPTSFWKAALATGWRQLDYLCATQCEWVYQNVAGEKAGCFWQGVGLGSHCHPMSNYLLEGEDYFFKFVCVQGWLRRCVGRTRCIAPCFGNWEATVCFQTCSMFCKPGTAIAAGFFALSTWMGPN